jgi:2-succinyl-5-enolpyruvyl-6-hydroxy-3-cyclohexene-1-carboxylate synthase
MATPADTTATFCATLVDEFVELGFLRAFVSPGSRSTPMARALWADKRVSLEVFHDERSCAFAALGSGMAGSPALVLCTSGTAATHFHAAVVEAHQSAVPLIVLTADRPPELQGVGAPQTIDQRHLFGSAVRAYIDATVPDEKSSNQWRDIARQAVACAVDTVTPGPVHVNLPFREPLVGEVGELPRRKATKRAPVRRPDTRRAAKALVSIAKNNHNGVFIAGRGATPAILEIAERLGWPVLADTRSGVRDESPMVVAAFDGLLRSEAFVATVEPSVVVRVGEPPASKVLGQWLKTLSCPVHQWCVDDRVFDPELIGAVNFVVDVDEVCRLLMERIDRLSSGDNDEPWLESWESAADRAELALEHALHDTWSEPSIARCVMQSRVGPLVVSSSMPIRDVEWYGGASGEHAVFSNRGVNGIDGVVSTAVGVALASGLPTTLLIGDIACVHDANGFWNLATRPADLRVVVVNNSGGAIFGFLPQAKELDADQFETLFGTPHAVSFEHLAATYGVPYRNVTTLDDLRAALAVSGPVLIEARTDRSTNVAAHDHVNGLIATAALTQSAD